MPSSARYSSIDRAGDDEFATRSEGGGPENGVLRQRLKVQRTRALRLALESYFVDSTDVGASSTGPPARSGHVAFRRCKREAGAEAIGAQVIAGKEAQDRAVPRQLELVDMVAGRPRANVDGHIEWGAQGPR